MTDEQYYEDLRKLENKIVELNQRRENEEALNTGIEGKYYTLINAPWVIGKITSVDSDRYIGNEIYYHEDYNNELDHDSHVSINPDEIGTIKFITKEEFYKRLEEMFKTCRRSFEQEE